jgi:hypothetical protein
MIQRIQSLWLFLSAAFIAAAFFFPFAEISTSSTHYLLKYRGIFQQTNKEFVVQNTAYLLAGSLTLVFILTILTIFLFKNRKLQMKMCLYISLLIIISSVGVLYFANFIIPQSNTAYSVASAFPIVSFIFILMARNRIKKDEELVRSTDRIR